MWTTIFANHQVLSERALAVSRETGRNVKLYLPRRVQSETSPWLDFKRKVKTKVLLLCRDPFHNVVIHFYSTFGGRTLIDIAARFVTAEALSLNTGPIAKIVVRISPRDPKRYTGKYDQD